MPLKIPTSTTSYSKILSPRRNVRIISSPLILLLLFIHVNVLCLDANPVLEESLSNMEGPLTDAPKRTVRRSHSLCEGEERYVLMRKQKVLESLKKHGINCELEDIPHIALLGSGGGQRSAVGLLGSLHQMEQDNLLDSMLYMLGVSGSTWIMSSMYREAPWSLDSVLETVRGPSVSFAQALDWLKDRTKEDDFSLADIWGILTAAGVMKEIDNRSLSHEAHREATNPYPIYSAIDKQSYVHGPTEGAWFELTPHECGFPELGLFIETSCLGSRFEGGEIVEERKEMDMVKLQGILGCALADEQYLGDMVIPDWMKADGLNATSTMGLYLQAYQILSKVVDLLKHSHGDHPSIATLEKLLEDNLKESKTHVPLDPETLKEISPEKHEQNFRNWGLNLTKSFETWCETLDESSFKSYLSWVTTHIFPLIVKWEWGTTNNFLHKYQDPAVPSSLQSSQHLYLIDGGLMINAPYPPVLGPKRDVDLIISLDSSAGDIFETLLLARDYSHKMKKPFPPINDSLTEEKEHPQDCYVFEGQPSDPTVMYMPLFNLQNCKDEEEIRKEKEEYATFQNPYSTKKMDHLLQKARLNIKNNKQKILKEIEKAVQRRQLKRESKMPKMP